MRPNSASREACKARFMNDKKNTQVVPICLIGMGLRINQQIFVLCAQGAEKTYLSLETWGMLGPTCTAHVTDPFAFLRPERKLYARVGPIPTPIDPNNLPHNIMIATQGFNWDQLEARCKKIKPPETDAFGSLDFINANFLLRDRRSMPVMDGKTSKQDNSPLLVTNMKRSKNTCTFALGSRSARTTT
jgi:hypothetical protein